MTLPRLEVITRHLCRPRRCALLERQQVSLRALLSDDWTQTVLVDHHQRGWGWTQDWLQRVEPFGQFVWVLDDDNLCADPDLISRLTPGIDLYVFGMRYVHTGLILPFAEHVAAKQAVRDSIGSANVIASRDLWMAARHAWTREYNGDYDYIAEAVRRASSVSWSRHVIADVDQENRGAA